MSTRKTSICQAPAWLKAAVYEPKRQRTFHLVKQAVNMLVEQHKQDGTIPISLGTILPTTRLLDPAGKGVTYTAILENHEAYAYYKRFRTASPSKKRPPAQRKGNGAEQMIKADRDLARDGQQYTKLNREELVDHLLHTEQLYAQLNALYLVTNDKLREWQRRAEQAEAQLNTWQEQSPGEHLLVQGQLSCGDQMADALGTSVDAGIREMVRVLNMLGIGTTTSCEGHIEHNGIGAPYIDFQVPGATQFQEQASQALQSGDHTRLSELANQAREEALPVVRPLFDLLVCFYRTHQVSYEQQLALCLADFGHGTLESHGANFQAIMPPEIAQQRLREYQEEMAAFAAFLKYEFDKRD